MTKTTTTRAPETASTDAPDELAAVLSEWVRALRREARAERTCEVYSEAVRQLETFLVTQGMPTDVTRINREHLEAFVDHLLATKARNTVNMRARALSTFFKWAVEAEIIPVSPMAKVKVPSAAEPVTPVLSDAELGRLFKACEGTRFEDRRDAAMVRLLADTGIRAAELMGLTTADLDRDQQVVYVVGKGSGRGARPRAVPYGVRTATYLDKYLRARTKAGRWAKTDALWVGQHGRMTPGGLRQMLALRATRAGLPRVHPHQLRHTFAHRWRVEGGDPVDLMRLGGWRSSAMLARYGASAADQRAHDAYRRLAIGDKL